MAGELTITGMVGAAASGEVFGAGLGRVPLEDLNGKALAAFFSNEGDVRQALELLGEGRAQLYRAMREDLEKAILREDKAAIRRAQRELEKFFKGFNGAWDPFRNFLTRVSAMGHLRFTSPAETKAQVERTLAVYRITAYLKRPSLSIMELRVLARQLLGLEPSQAVDRIKILLLLRVLRSENPNFVELNGASLNQTDPNAFFANLASLLDRHTREVLRPWAELFPNESELNPFILQ